jgi:hypothetical protein
VFRFSLTELSFTIRLTPMLVPLASSSSSLRIRLSCSAHVRSGLGGTVLYMTGAQTLSAPPQVDGASAKSLEHRTGTNRGWKLTKVDSTKTYGLTPQVCSPAASAKLSPRDCTTEQLFEIVMDVARRFRTAKEVVTEHRDYILRLKAEVFKVRFGSLGARVPVKLNAAGKGLPLVRRMCWKEFCESQFGVTADWINRLCCGKGDGPGLVDSAENQDGSGYPKSLKLDGRQQAALLRSHIAANEIVAALKNGGDWQALLPESEKVAIAPATLEAYLHELQEQPDWRAVLAKLMSTLELSGDTLPFIVKIAMQAARTLLGDEAKRETAIPSIPYPGGKGLLASTLSDFA